MKVCQLCGDTYKEHIDFCFNDGEILAVADAATLAQAQPTTELDAPLPRLVQGDQEGVGATLPPDVVAAAAPTTPPTSPPDALPDAVPTPPPEVALSPNAEGAETLPPDIITHQTTANADTIPMVRPGRPGAPAFGSETGQVGSDDQTVPLRKPSPGEPTPGVQAPNPTANAPTLSPFPAEPPSPPTTHTVTPAMPVPGQPVDLTPSPAQRAARAPMDDHRAIDPLDLDDDDKTIPPLDLDEDKTIPSLALDAAKTVPPHDPGATILPDEPDLPPAADRPTPQADPPLATPPSSAASAETVPPALNAAPPPSRGALASMKTMPPDGLVATPGLEVVPDSAKETIPPTDYEDREPLQIAPIGAASDAETIPFARPQRQQQPAQPPAAATNAAPNAVANVGAAQVPAGPPIKPAVKPIPKTSGVVEAIPPNNDSSSYVMVFALMGVAAMVMPFFMGALVMLWWWVSVNPVANNGTDAVPDAPDAVLTAPTPPPPGPAAPPEPPTPDPPARPNPPAAPANSTAVPANPAPTRVDPAPEPVAVAAPPPAPQPQISPSRQPTVTLLISVDPVQATIRAGGRNYQPGVAFELEPRAQTIEITADDYCTETIAWDGTTALREDVDLKKGPWCNGSSPPPAPSPIPDPEPIAPTPVAPPPVPEPEGEKLKAEVFFVGNGVFKIGGNSYQNEKASITVGKYTCQFIPDDGSSRAPWPCKIDSTTTIVKDPGLAGAGSP